MTLSHLVPDVLSGNQKLSEGETKRHKVKNLISKHQEEEEEEEEEEDGPFIDHNHMFPAVV